MTAAELEPVVQLDHVSRRFGPVLALADLSLVVPPGSITVLAEALSAVGQRSPWGTLLA